MVCPHRQGRLSQYILRTREERVNFSRFCADVFYGWPCIGGINYCKSKETLKLRNLKSIVYNSIKENAF